MDGSRRRTGTLDPAKKDYIKGWIPEAKETVAIALKTIKQIHKKS